MQEEEEQKPEELPEEEEQQPLEEIEQEEIEHEEGERVSMSEAEISIADEQNLEPDGESVDQDILEEVKSVQVTDTYGEEAKTEGEDYIYEPVEAKIHFPDVPEPTATETVSSQEIVYEPEVYLINLAAYFH